MRTEDKVGFGAIGCSLLIVIGFICYIVYDTNWAETTDYRTINYHDKNTPYLKPLITECKKDGYVSKYEMRCLDAARRRIESAKEKSETFNAVLD